MGRSKIVLLIIILTFSFAYANVPTKIFVENTPPRLIQNFSTIYIISDFPTLNAIDLDDYFAEDNGDILNITHTPLQNVTITIDSEHRVSFYPDPGYIGEQQMQFTVADIAGNATSNVFNLSVGMDTIPPKWSSPGKNRENIYQNYHVNFTANWRDNAALAYYTFSINQGAGWIDSAQTIFTGQINISQAQAQISASPGTIVQWKFSATDMYGNTNTTSIQNFTVKTSSNPGTPNSTNTDPTTGHSVAAEEKESGLLISKTTGFKTDTQYIKTTLRQGDTQTKVVRITNIGETPLSFKANVTYIQSLTMLSEKSFILESGETMELLIDFTIPKETTPDQYFGELTIEADDIIQIPIILDIKNFESEISATLSISEKYKNVIPEKEVIATLVVENLKDVRKTNSNLYYAIKDFQGNVIVSDNKEIQLFTTFEDKLTLIVPKNTEKKEYIFYVRVVAEDKVDLDSDTFNVGFRFKFLKFLKNVPYLILVLILMIIIIILVIIKRRDNQKRRILELYLLLTELKSLVQKGKTTEAIDIYKRIKVVYGQRIPKTFQEDKEKLKAELDKFSKLLKQTPITIPAQAKSNQVAPQGSNSKTQATEKNPKPLPQKTNPKEPIKQNDKITKQPIKPKIQSKVQSLQPTPTNPNPKNPTSKPLPIKPTKKPKPQKNPIPKKTLPQKTPSKITPSQIPVSSKNKTQETKK